MRPIKFRVWYRGHLYDRANLYIEPDYTRVEIIKGRGNNVHTDSEKAKLMQFTGLLDKNGKEIYERDVYKIGDKIFEVIFESGAFVLKHGTEKNRHRLHNATHNGEVIGNVCENPNLLQTS
jgi:uncharacterized phage protein (TIGR01671 family)